MFLSGTAVPFVEKLQTFRRLLFSGNASEQVLASGGLSHLIADHVTRMSSPSLVGGRLPPSDWYPQSQQEWDACLSAMFDLLDSMFAASPQLSDHAWEYLTKHLRTLLSQRQLDRLRRLIGERQIPEGHFRSMV